MKQHVYLIGLLAGCLVVGAAEFPQVKNTQKADEEPPKPEDSVNHFTVPEGFSVKLVVGEPRLNQPIAMTFDDRGRIWVIEHYTYNGHRFDANLRDRILIFEDADHNGTFETRKVFWDEGDRLTSLVLGFDGVFILNAETLSFIPDRTGDDVPDGPPEVLLDGFECDRIGHNIVNGLLWGPDGWLYARHGIQANSRIGAPGAPDSKRVSMNCGIWRYHPERKVVERLVQGTVNPWGMDYNDEGEFFFSNNVKGHFWHMVPGMHFIRMYGEDYKRYVYELLDQTADHYHFDTGKGWTGSRNAAGKSDELGGGHSHCGGMFYLGDAWPKKYRNSFFMNNTHGRRLNRDIPERKGAGYTAKHGEDFFFANNPWYRGVDVRLGPDGSVFVSDWVDFGECHDHDGIHRTSGRIYQIDYGSPEKKAPLNLKLYSNDELADLVPHQNEFYVRHARRILTERARHNGDLGDAAQAKLQALLSHEDHRVRLRALWCLYTTGQTDAQLLRRMLKDPNEHVRAWAVRLLADQPETLLEGLLAIEDLARNDVSGLVQLHIVSAMQKLPLKKRYSLVSPLLKQAARLQDPTFTMMLYWAIEPIEPTWLMVTFIESRELPLPRIHRYTTRRLCEDFEANQEPLNRILDHAESLPDIVRKEVVQGMTEALRGRRNLEPPKSWAYLKKSLASSEDAGIKRYLRELAGIFGDGEMIKSFEAIAKDQSAGALARRNALKVLSENPTPELKNLFFNLVNDRATDTEAIRGLGAYDDPKIPSRLLNVYHRLDDEGRLAAVNVLSTRPHYAAALLEAVKKGDVQKGDITAFHARQMDQLKDRKVNDLLEKHWGQIKTTDADKKKQIHDLKKSLTEEVLAKADRSQGRRVFDQVCSACHTLYGEGGTVGPDLTGGNRDNLDYLLENTVDPNALLGDNFKTVAFTLNDGRTLMGAIEAQSEHTVQIRTQTEKLSVARADIKKTEAFPISLMPEGLLTGLKPEQIRNLIAYLNQKEQVPLPKEL